MPDSSSAEVGTQRVADRVRVPPPILFLAAVGSGIGLHLAFPMQLLSHRGLALGIGLVIFTLGVGLLFASVKTLRAARTDHTCLKPSTAIVRNGPFRWSRNPIYVAVLLWLCGLSFAVNTVWHLLLVPALFAFFFWVVIQEERYLERNFGEDYLRYKSSVRRWI